MQCVDCIECVQINATITVPILAADTLNSAILHTELCHGHGEDMIYTRLQLGHNIRGWVWSMLWSLVCTRYIVLTDIQGSRATSFV